AESISSSTNPCDWGTATARWLGPPPITGLNPASGPNQGGTAVTIAGHGFSYATAVTFGGTPAGFTVDSDTSITTTAPPQPVAAYPTNDGMIRVTAPSG